MPVRTHAFRADARPVNRAMFLTLLALSGSALSLSLASPALADATPECNVGGGFDSTECGVSANASGDFSTATGNSANASGDFSTATGISATASGASSTATGISATASGASSTATGGFATASGDFSTATGRSANASATNSVALGANSVADQANTVSVGGVGTERRIVNVANGTAGTDAVNKSQLDDVNDTAVAAQTTADTAASQNMVQDTQIAAIQTVNTMQNSRLTSLEGIVGTAIPGLQALTALHSTQIGDLYAVTDRDRRQARRGTAAAVALTAAPMPSEPGKTSYTFNLATYRGEQAAGASIAHRFMTDSPFALTAGVSYAGKGDTAARVGVAGEF